MQSFGGCGYTNHTPKHFPPQIRCTYRWLFQGESQDLLMFMTARYHLAVVSYDRATGHLVTRAYGDIKVWHRPF